MSTMTANTETQASDLEPTTTDYVTGSVWEAATLATDGAEITVHYDSIKGSGIKQKSGQIKRVVTIDGTVQIRFKRDDGTYMNVDVNGLLRTPSSYSSRVGYVTQIEITDGIGDETERPELDLAELADEREDNPAWMARDAIRRSPAEGEDIFESTMPARFLDDGAHEVAHGVAWGSDLTRAVFKRAIGDTGEECEDPDEPSVEERIESSETTPGLRAAVDLSNGVKEWTETGLIVGVGALNVGDRVAVVPVETTHDYVPESMAATVKNADSSVTLESMAGRFELIDEPDEYQNSLVGIDVCNYHTMIAGHTVLIRLD